MVKKIEKNYLSECYHCYCIFHKQASSEVQKPTDINFAFFAAVNRLSGSLRKQKFTSIYGFKRSWFVIGGFRSVLCFCVSRFIACDRNYD